MPTGRRATWRPPGALFFLIAILVVILGRSFVQRRADAARIARVDPRLFAAEGRDPWDPRWERVLAEVVSDFGSLAADDAEGVEALAGRIARLSFVAEAGEPRVAWPDGMTLSVRYVEPVACVFHRGGYLALSGAGRLLPGRHGEPPVGPRGPLPVLGPVDDAFADAFPGDELVLLEHRDALSVARSMDEHLSRADRDRLGTIVIDATRAREASVEVVGVLLYLANKRLVEFGRSPNLDHPGELPARKKWIGLARGLRTSEPWTHLDVRWDRPRMVQPEEEQPEAEESR